MIYKNHDKWKNHKYRSIDFFFQLNLFKKKKKNLKSHAHLPMSGNIFRCDFLFSYAENTSTEKRRNSHKIQFI